MKFFPASILPDPDKKFNLLDSSLVSQIVEKLLIDDEDLRMIKQEDINNQGDTLLINFLKKKKGLWLSFKKISIYGNGSGNSDNRFDSDLLDSFWCCMHDIKPFTPFDTKLYIERHNPWEIETKKVCGIKISISRSEEISFAVGSKDMFYNNLPNENKLNECAHQNLPLYIDWIQKNWGKQFASIKRGQGLMNGTCTFADLSNCQKSISCNQS